MMSPTCEIRPPGVDAAAGIVDLKTEWSDLENTPEASERAAFARQRGEWIDRHGDSLVCRIAATAGGQSVYVDPAYRGQGIGRALVESVLAEADARGVLQITVHSNPRANTMYERAGFARERTLLARLQP